MKNYIDILQRVEYQVDFLSKNAVDIPYKKVGDVWIKANHSLIKL